MRVALQPAQRPVHLVHMFLYEGTQFFDEFEKMSQTTLHLLLQHLSKSVGFVSLQPDQTVPGPNFVRCLYSETVVS